MGPNSKQAVCDAIGHLVDAVQTLDGTLARIERLLAQRAEQERSDLVHVNRRITALERWRLNGGKPSPA